MHSSGRRGQQRSVEGKNETAVDTGINKIAVSFGMQYANLLSPAESQPAILCYMSVPVQGSVLEIPVPENDPAHSTKVVMEGALQSGAMLPKDTQVATHLRCFCKYELTDSLLVGRLLRHLCAEERVWRGLHHARGNWVCAAHRFGGLRDKGTAPRCDTQDAQCRLDREGQAETQRQLQGCPHRLSHSLGDVGGRVPSCRSTTGSTGTGADPTGTGAHRVHQQGKA